MALTKAQKKQGCFALLLFFLVLGAYGYYRYKIFVTDFNCNFMLYAMTPVFYEYPREHPDGLFPEMSSRPGRFHFEPEDTFPVEHKGDYAWGTEGCSAEFGFLEKWGFREKFEQQSFVYLGYALTNEEEMLAFLDSYPKYMEEGVGFSKDLPAPPGKGTFGGDVFVRLSQEFWEKNRGGEVDIPLYIEVPDFDDEGNIEHRHRGDIVCVFDLSSQNGYVRAGNFPNTERIHRKIDSLRKQFYTPPNPR